MQLTHIFVVFVKPMSYGVRFLVYYNGYWAMIESIIYSTKLYIIIIYLSQLFLIGFSRVVSSLWWRDIVNIMLEWESVDWFLRVV